jgi:hypothetical protein
MIILPGSTNTGVRMITYEQVHEWMALANLLILVGVLMLIGLSMFLEKKRKFVWHGNSMLVVMMITGLLVIVHMAPSFVSAVGESLSGFDTVATMGVVHGVIGVVALFLGVWLVGTWAYIQSGETRFCMARRKWMWRILALWLLSLGLGGLYYVLHISFG